MVSAYLSINLVCLNFHLFDIFLIGAISYVSCGIFSYLVAIFQQKYSQSLGFHKGLVWLGLVTLIIGLTMYDHLQFTDKYTQIIISQTLLGISQCFITKGTHFALLNQSFDIQDLLNLKVSAQALGCYTLSIAFVFADF